MRRWTPQNSTMGAMMPGNAVKDRTSIPQIPSNSWGRTFFFGIHHEPQIHQVQLGGFFTMRKKSISATKSKDGHLGPGYYWVFNPRHIKKMMKKQKDYKYCGKAKVKLSKIHKVKQPSTTPNLKKWIWKKYKIVKDRHHNGHGAMGVGREFWMINCKRSKDFKVCWVKSKKSYLHSLKKECKKFKNK